MITKLDHLIESFYVVIRANSTTRVNGKVASNRTQEISQQVMASCAKRLHGLGFYLQSVEGLGRKHIDALVLDWYSGGKGNKLSAKTIQNNFSRLKIFCGWAGKGGIISPLGAIGHLEGVDPKELKVTTVATKSKSWSANGVDVGAKILEASAQDRRHGAMLLLDVAFGVRKKEQLRVKPWKADKGLFLEISDGVGKGDKYRVILFEHGTPEKDAFGRAQRWALDEAKKVCKKSETLGWSGLTYKQSENRYYHYMQRLGLTKAQTGVTAHGLRAEFAENLLLLNGLMPPSLGGTAQQMPKSERDGIMLDAANKLGHNDLHTSTAYYSSFRKDFVENNLGGKLGRVIAVDSEKDHFAVVYANPMPAPQPNGSYAPLSEEARARTLVTVVLEMPGQEDTKMSLADFANAYPFLSSRLTSQLSFYGLLEFR